MEYLFTTYLKLKRSLLPGVSHLHFQPQSLFFLADTLHEVADLLQPLHRYGRSKKFATDLLSLFTEGTIKKVRCGPPPAFLQI
jgi:hypothetical protein